MLLLFLSWKVFTQCMVFDNRQTIFLHSLCTSVMRNKMEIHVHITYSTLHFKYVRITNNIQVEFPEYRVHSVNVIRWIKSECILLLLLTADVGSFIHAWLCMTVFEPFRCFHYICLFFILFLVVQTCVRGERMFSNTNQTHIEFMMFYVNCGTQLEYKTYGFKQPELLVRIQYNVKWKKKWEKSMDSKP